MYSEQFLRLTAVGKHRVACRRKRALSSRCAFFLKAQGKTSTSLAFSRPFFLHPGWESSTNVDQAEHVRESLRIVRRTVT